MHGAELEERAGVHRSARMQELDDGLDPSRFPDDDEGVAALQTEGRAWGRDGVAPSHHGDDRDPGPRPRPRVADGLARVGRVAVDGDPIDRQSLDRLS